VPQLNKYVELSPYGMSQTWPKIITREQTGNNQDLVPQTADNGAVTRDPSFS